MLKYVIRIGAVLFVLLAICFVGLIALSYCDIPSDYPCANGCDYVLDHTVPATCTEGEQVWNRCTRCGDVSWHYVEGTEKGHDLVDYQCTVCDYEDLPQTVRQKLLVFTLTKNREAYTVKMDGGMAAGRVEIPETLYKMPIVEIEEKAFMGQANITEITIPDGIVTIGESAFEGCTSLTAVALGKGVDTVGERAFYGCTSLTEATMCKGVNEIGEAAFGGCGKLQKLVIPFVGRNKAINYKSRDGYDYTLGHIFGKKSYSGAQPVTMQYKKLTNNGPTYPSATYYIPASLRYVEVTVGNYEGNSYDENFYLEEGAFHNCTMIKELVLAPTIIAARGCALTGLTSLERLIAPGFNSHYTALEMPSLIEFDAEWMPVSRMSKLQKLTWRNVTAQQDLSNLAQYEKLTDITLVYAEDVQTVKLEQLTPILDKLKGILFTSTKTAFEEGALSSLTSLKRVALSYDMLADIDMQHLEELQILSDGAYAVSKTLLAAAPNLKSLTLNSHLTGFAEGAFENCPLLERVKFDGTSEALLREDLLVRWLSLSFGGVRSNPLTHGAGLYFETTDGVEPIGAVTLPSDLTALGAYVFDGCNNITVLTFDGSITAIGEDAFAGTVALETVHFGGTLAQWCGIVFENAEANPVNGAQTLIIGGEKLTELKGDPGVTTLGAYTFCGYQGLTKATIPSGITKIGTQAFSGCAALLEVALPESIIRIEAHAFEGCALLTSVIFAELAEWACFVEGEMEDGTLIYSDTVNNPILVAQHLAGTYADCVWEKLD